MPGIGGPPCILPSCNNVCDLDEKKPTMDCIITCCSSAALSSSFRTSRSACVLDYSSSSSSSSSSSTTAYLRSSPPCKDFSSLHKTSSPFRNFSSLLEISPTFSSSVPVAVVVCSNASPSPLQKQEYRSSAPNPRDEENGAQNLSAKERRKLRNERREAAKASQEQPWKEMVQERLLEPQKKIRGWREDADINRCIAKGVQWWMIQTGKKYEFEVADQVAAVFQENFPGRDFKVFVPTVPVKLKLKGGSVSLARKKLYPGTVLLRCLLDRDVYFMVRGIRHTYEFFGNQAGLSSQPIVMPAPVSNFNMDLMFQKIQKQEAEYEDFKEQCRRELEEEKREKQRKDKEQEQWDAEQSKGLVLAVGANVRVLSGPFLDFTGVVVQLLPENKIKAVVTVFGNATSIVLDVKDVVVEAPVGDRRSSKTIYNM